jgi:hypothetical protein
MFEALLILYQREWYKQEWLKRMREARYTDTDIEDALKRDPLRYLRSTPAPAGLYPEVKKVKP